MARHSQSFILAFFAMTSCAEKSFKGGPTVSPPPQVAPATPAPPPEPPKDPCIITSFLPPNGFTDIGDSPHKADIIKSAELGMLRGNDAGQFEPKKPFTREDYTYVALQILKCVPGINIQIPDKVDKAPFPDVAATRPLASAIATAHSLGVVKGYTDGTFQPERTIALGELAAMLTGLVRHARQALQQPAEPSSFQNAKIITGTESHWAKTPIAQLIAYCPEALPLPPPPQNILPDLITSREYGALVSVAIRGCIIKDLTK